MTYTNSPLVVHTNLSPNHSGLRNHAIDTITIHCVVGQVTVESLGSWFARPSTEASSNYGVDKDGRIGMYVEEKNRSWCSSSASNDNRAITIEVASDTYYPYAVTNAAYEGLLKLVTDICKRNGIKALKWKADPSLIGQSDKQNMTVHRWFANKSCPGEYLYSRHGAIAAEVNKRLGAVSKPVDTDLQASSLKDLSEEQVIEKVGTLFTADQKSSGILASVSLAQFILESGYGKSELAQKANNLFGMKKSLSGNTWKGSTWDGSSVYKKETQEYDGTKYITITSEFRKYPNILKSITDHSAYLLGAMNGSKARYAGLKGEKDYKKAITIIKNGGYATSPTYIEKLCFIIEKWGLTKFDLVTTSTGSDPFTVKVLIDDLNYRSEPSMLGAVKGQTGKGIFTIMEVKNGWGRLKSGAGWIYIDNPEYCTINSSVTSSPKPSVKSIETLAKEVIRGDWGNGQDRINRLTSAGYDYNAVQNRVNQLV